MKINSRDRFPHPVLAPFLDDFRSGNIDFSPEVQEVVETGHLNIRPNIDVTHREILRLIEEGHLSLSLSVVCLETFHSEQVTVPSKDFQFSIAPGLLRGRVRLRPLIVAIEPIQNFSAEDLHLDYGDQLFDLPIGTVLGIGPEVLVNIGPEKLAPMEAIFKIAKDENLDPGEFNVIMDRPSIVISADPELYEIVHHLRANSRHRAIALNAVYVPAIMQVVSALQEGDSGFSDHRWHRIFVAKCDHAGIDLQNDDLLEIVQKLLKAPARHLSKVLEA